MFIDIQRYGSLAGLLVTLRHLCTSTDSIYKCHIAYILCTRHQQLGISRTSLLFLGLFNCCILFSSCKGEHTWFYAACQTDGRISPYCTLQYRHFQSQNTSMKQYSYLHCHGHDGVYIYIPFDINDETGTGTGVEPHKLQDLAEE